MTDLQQIQANGNDGSRTLRIPLETCDTKNVTQLGNERNSSSSKTSKFNFSAGILVRAKANDTGIVLLGMMVVFCIFAVIVIRRLWILEMKNAIIEAQLQGYQSTLNKILNQVPIVVVPELNEVPNGYGKLNEADEKLKDFPGVRQDQAESRIRRDVVENNIGNGGGSIGSQFPPTSEGNINSKKRIERRVKDRGKYSQLTNIRKSKDKELVKHLKLKLKLANSRRRASEAAAKFTKSKPVSSSCTSPTANFSEAKAVYMIPLAPNVDINKPEQLIGPWYIGDGMDFGFNDLWYSDISLDANRTSVIFKESGLHLIYAQVYYHLSLGIGESPAPMGFRIYIKKNPAKPTMFRRSIPIAECVPSYPNTFYQTCFTQVAWYVEEGDQIYLEHFANSFPMIEADRQGKTFLGIVRLSSPQ